MEKEISSSTSMSTSGLFLARKWINAVDLNDWGTLREISRHNNLSDCFRMDLQVKTQTATYWYSHQFADVLNFMTRRCRAQTFKFRPRLRL